MTESITIQRGHDGFGSQMCAILSGIAYCRKNNLSYIHSPLEHLKLVNMDINNKELDNCNDVVNGIIRNLHLPIRSASDVCKQKPFFYDEIYAEGPAAYYTEEFLRLLPSSYPKEKPLYYQNNKFNIAIHMRLGKDLVSSDIPIRTMPQSFYNDLITKLQVKYPDAIIHIFSWGDPGLSVSGNIQYHTSDSGYAFIEDFNGLVHSDLLIVASSTFSVSAGYFNKNVVACDISQFKLTKVFVPNTWIDNFRILI